LIHSLIDLLIYQLIASFIWLLIRLQRNRKQTASTFNSNQQYDFT